MNTETLKKMNNTDFFNSHRAEAIKLIAESVYPDFNWKITGGKVWAAVNSEICLDFNPCSGMPEGDKQAYGVLIEYSHLCGGVNPKELMRDKKALCIAYLDMIRKV